MKYLYNDICTYTFSSEIYTKLDRQLAWQRFIYKYIRIIDRGLILNHIGKHI